MHWGTCSYPLYRKDIASTSRGLIKMNTLCTLNYQKKRVHRHLFFSKKFKWKKKIFENLQKNVQKSRQVRSQFIYLECCDIVSPLSVDYELMTEQFYVLERRLLDCLDPHSACHIAFSARDMNFGVPLRLKVAALEQLS